MKKILLCGLKYDSNYGDPIICECCKSLIKQILIENNKINDFEIEEIDISGRTSFKETYYIKKNIKYITIRIIGKILGLLKKITKKIKLKKAYNWLDMKKWNFTKESVIMKKYFIPKIENSNIIIFTGGGMLKYKYQNCYNYINEITKIADEKNIPVCLNAVGVEGYDEKNIKCRLLKKAVNRKCIKMITTRDDISKLEKYIENSDIIIKKVSDSATYANIVYNVKKDDKSKIIGLCMCRGNLFIDNEINYSESELMKLWKNIIEDLDNKNIKWKIYTNGLQADNEFVYKFVNKYQYGEKNYVIPANPEELVKAISLFKGIIATRLHSCIIAYSLDVPAIGLVWNKKLKLFGESIGYSQRFFEFNDFNSKKIIDELEKSIKEKYTKIPLEEYRKGVKIYLKKFLETYCKGD